jgi:hypothetical protein
MLAKSLRGPSVQLGKLRPPAAVGSSATGTKFPQVDASPIGENPHGLDEPDIFTKLNKAENIAAATATEALEGPVFRSDRKRGGLLGVKRTQPHPALPPSLHGNVLGNYVQQIHPFQDRPLVLREIRQPKPLARSLADELRAA